MKRIILLTGLIAAGIALSPASYAKGDRGEHRAGISFSDLDSNGDGALTMAELAARAAGRFAEADSNGDGILDRAELLAAGRKANEKRVDRMLERLDSDGSGTLSQAEMKEGRGGKRKGRGLERVFEHMDADGDGSVTEAEFEQAKKSRKGRRHGKRSGASE